MKTIIAENRCVLLGGDAQDLGSVLPPESVDAIVTDPPGGIGFMNKAWDSNRGGRDKWVTWLAGALAPSFAALKPGGFALVWAIPRTSHWTALALELVGFEICDRVSHLFGTGFPKSISLGRQVDMSVCPASGRHYDKNLPAEAKRRPDDHLCAQDERGDPFRGIGSALKPACEDWWLCQKPFRGTYAANVLEHGTGGLNIDACRIGDEVRFNPPAANKAGGASFNMSVVGMPQDAEGREAVGRWPAHVVLDEETAAVLDASVPASKSTPSKGPRGKRSGGFVDTGAGKGDSTPNGPQYADAGGPSRFFYVAKPSRAEKEDGLAHLPKRTAGEATDRADGSAGLGSPRAGAGRTGGARNFHPTVKSIALMRWLIRLITPPGGVVLDPFCGSGTTGVAARVEGCFFVGVEGDPDYLPIAEGRLRAAAVKFTVGVDEESSSE